MLALLLLGPTASAVAGGQDVLADAQDNGRIDACYSRAEFQEALRLARDDQRLYSAAIDVIQEAQFSNVAVPGEPCGGGQTVPDAAADAGGGGSAGLWIGLAVAVGVVAVGAGAWARRGPGRGAG